MASLFSGALGVSAFRRSGKLRHSTRWFGRSTNRLTPIHDKSSGSSNISSPLTKFTDESGEDDDGGGYTANDSQRMFLIIEMLEKYLKLSSDASPLLEGDSGGAANQQNECSSSSPNEYYDSSAFTSPDNLSPPPITHHENTYQYQQQQQPQKLPTKKHSLGSNDDASTSKSSTHTSFASSESSSYRPSANLNRRPIGSQHTSLLLENLRNYGRKNRSSLLSTMNFTPAVVSIHSIRGCVCVCVSITINKTVSFSLHKNS